jgi:cytochrome b561
MNHLLYNIAIVMLLLGIILMTSYLTKAYDMPSQNIPKTKSPDQSNNTIEEAYNSRPSQIFDAMFSKPSLWQGYESTK